MAMKYREMVEAIIEHWNDTIVTSKYRVELSSCIGKSNDRSLPEGEWSELVIWVDSYQGLLFRKAHIIKKDIVEQEEIQDKVWKDLFFMISMSGINAEQRDFMSGRKRYNGSQLVITPTADELLAKLGIKLSAV